MAKRKTRVVRRPRAVRDIVEIAVYIGQNSPAAAQRFVDASDRTFALLADQPRLGRIYAPDNPQLTAIRCLAVSDFPRYLIFYRLSGATVEVVRVLHGARDLMSILEGE
jgi:toxin ParE1/3/4